MISVEVNGVEFLCAGSSFYSRDCTEDSPRRAYNNKPGKQVSEYGLYINQIAS